MARWRQSRFRKYPSASAAASHERRHAGTQGSRRIRRRLVGTYTWDRQNARLKARSCRLTMGSVQVALETPRFKSRRMNRSSRNTR